ncbi:hypothetical protein TCAL_16625 [Tigriopus californicus]|uniref:dTCF n=1 Tax=Tigriopus californicus TaxID=6832 RepID=A0A553NDL0_TIGCA|nr:hypothetical protein TCAL_16625 [Tigriopus californicus]
MTARSPYLYGDPLSSPPPAHMGTYLDKAGVAGLRPPLYGLPPHAAAAAAAGYPYHMLGADQLAAWHHQAAYGLRPGSPYSLPITSTSLSSMSRFSPTGFLSHPGLAAAVAAGSPVGAGVHGQHLPQHMKQEYGHSRGSHHHSDKDLLSPSKASKRDSHIKKPLNAFMLYMKEMRPVVQAECTLKESAAINQILGRRWHGLSRDEQAKYYEKARAERQKHMQMYPHWNARDNYRFGLKKKKRKRDKADDPAEQAKYYDQARKERQIHMDRYPGWTARDNYAKHKKKKRRKEVIRDGNGGSGGGGVSNGDSAGGASSMKKCRARFGLDQQDLWCKPCSNTLVAIHLFEDPPSVSSQYVPPTPYYDQMPPNSYEDPSFGSPISTPMSQHDLIADMYDMSVPTTAPHSASMSMAQHPNSLGSSKEGYDNSSAPYSNEPKYISL